MGYQLNLSRRAEKGLQDLARSGNAGKLKQTKKALLQLEQDPQYSSLRTHRLSTNNRSGPHNHGWAKDRDDLWISCVRIGPGGERIVWSFGEKTNDVQVINVEYIGAHLE